MPRENKVVRSWGKEQIKTFIEAPELILNLTRHFIGYELQIQTGMRMGEVLGLRWSDIDLDRKIITIRQTLAKIDESGKYGLVTETKTYSSFRQIYLQDSLCQSLMKHKEKNENEKKILDSKYTDNDLVVCKSSGNWVHPNNYRRAFKVTCEYLELPKIRVHDLRHTHATFLIGILQVNPKIVQ